MRSSSHAHLFAALGDPTRLRLVSRLCAGGPASITHLTEGGNVTRQAVSKHLKVMKKSGLVRCSRRGRESVWQLDPQRLEDARHYLEVISRQWDAALSRLQKFVENE